VAAGVTTTLAPVTGPTPPSIESDVAPVTDQARVDDPPGATCDGDAVNEAITGGSGVTVTVAVDVADPVALVAVNVYVVVAVGLTTTLVPVTVPTPLSIESDVAPVTDQSRVAGSPATTVDGVAANEAIVGGVFVSVQEVSASAASAAIPIFRSIRIDDRRTSCSLGKWAAGQTLIGLVHA
jgi:hypothetical protein